MQVLSSFKPSRVVADSSFRAALTEEKIKPAPAWAVYAMLVVWYGAALVLNGTFRSALVQDLGARGAKEAIAAEARMKMGL